MKPIQKITAWRYPCEGEPFYFHLNSFLMIDELIAPVKTKKYLLSGNFDSLKCDCGKNCKPEKIIIEVRKA